MRALVTGITGFVGGYLAPYLLAQGDRVLGCSSTGRWHADDLQPWCAQVPLVEWNIACEIPDSTLDAIRGFKPDCVYHLAAMSVPADCGTDEPTARAEQVNNGGTVRVVDLCRDLQPRPRLLFVSSSHVYGSAAEGPFWVSEDTPPAPVNGYGKSKLHAERSALDAAQKGELEVVVARSFQHTGPRQSPRMMLPEWALQFARGDDPVKVQRRNAIIDLSDARDIVRAYRLLMQCGKTGFVYNVGSGRQLRSGDVLAELHRLADPARSISEQSEKPKYDPIAMIDRIRAATGWEPTIDWRQTVADTWHYWLAAYPKIAK